MPPKPLRLHYRHWAFCLPLLNRYQAICLGRHILFKGGPETLTASLLAHEWVHQEQIARDGAWRFYFRYLAEYFWLWLRYRDHVRAYRGIRYEQEAYRRQDDAQLQQMAAAAWKQPIKSRTFPPT